LSAQVGATGTRPTHLGDLISRLPDPAGLGSSQIRPDVTSSRTSAGRSATVTISIMSRGASIAMAIVAHTRPFVIGVDTHARNHAISILACPIGEIVDEAQFPATTAGLSRAASWAARRTGGDAGVLWAIEGTDTHGARLARAASDAGYAVLKAPRMNARANHGIGKSDPLDSRRIAAAALPLQDTQLREPQTDGGLRAAAKVLLTSRDHMSTERRRDDQRAHRAAAGGRSRHRRTPPAHRHADRHPNRTR